ncbi:MAG: RloB domain-containing protein [Myxococcales bacterium]|nr:RloB domain-containing protein [Myxococcales bacterium]
MSDDCTYDPHWWLTKKAESLARKQQQVPKSALAAPGDAFLIVTEGTVAEPHYFEQLRRRLLLSLVHVRVTPGDSSDPRQVIQTAARLATEQVRGAKRGTLPLSEPEMFDHVFAVIDADVAVRQKHWNDVVQLASARKVQLVPSMPCFEFWLLLHLGYTTRTDLVDGDAAKSALKQALGCEYAKNASTIRSAIDTLLSKWRDAMVSAERVQKLHDAAATPAPANPSTEVWRLVQALADAVHPSRHPH